MPSLNPVAIPLFGEKQLAMASEILLAAALREQRVETGPAPIAFGTQYTAQALGLLLARSVASGDLDQDICIGQIDCEVTYSRQRQAGDVAITECFIEAFSFFLSRLSGEQGKTALARY